MTTQPTVLAKAKQGEPTAIATLMNQTLSTKGICVKIKRREHAYQILVESAQIPDKATAVKWIVSGLKKLSIREMNTITIYGKAQASTQPDWIYHFRFSDQQQSKPVDPFADLVPQKQQSLPSATATPDATSAIAPPAQSASDESRSDESALDLTAYCFTRNKSLLTGNLTLPSKAVIETVLLFIALPNAEKLTLLPHVEKLLRKPEAIADETLSAQSNAWIAHVIELEGNDLRKLSIWLSRYCANPMETAAQLTPQPLPAASAASSAEKETPPPPAKISTPPVNPTRATTRVHSSSAMASGLSPSPQGQQVMFAKGSNTPIWVFPAVCSLFLVIAIALGIRSVEETAYLYPICEDTSARSESCVLAVQLTGDEALMAETLMYARPAVTEPMKNEAMTQCAQLGYEIIAAADTSGTRPYDRDDSVTLKSGQTEEVFPGMLLTNIVLTDHQAGDAPTRTACVNSAYQYSEADAFELGVTAGDVGLENISFDAIPMNWPDEPYAEIASDELSVARSLGIYDVFISLGANTLFTAIGIFVAVLFSACYRCYTYTGIYQMASVLGVIETIMHSIPGFGLFASLAMDVVAMGLASRFVKDFHIDWTGGYGPLARGVVMITAVRVLLSFLLYGAIAQMVR